MVASAVSIPVIACGGAGKIDHISQVISEGNADAVAISSLLHYDFIRKNKVEIDSPEVLTRPFRADRESLRSRIRFGVS
jgi:cyclase